MTQDYKEQFDQQIAFIKTSAAAYDDGNESEARRLAVNLRLLAHDSRHSVSLPSHLGVKNELPFVDTAAPEPSPGAIVFFNGGLCLIRH